MGKEKNEGDTPKKKYIKPPPELYYCVHTETHIIVTNEGITDGVLYEDLKYLLRNKQDTLNEFTIFRIDSEGMYRDKNKFSKTSQRGWTTKHVPSRYIDVML